MTRQHAASDLNVYLSWCRGRGLAPLANRRGHLELYVRWLQETRRFKPSTVSRRVSVLAGFYRTAVIDGLMESSPAEHLRRPRVPPESPTLGLTHLQFEALLTAARTSANQFDFALICLLGLLGLRIFEACGVDVEDLREEHGHRVLRVLGKGGRVVLVPLPPAVGRAVDRAVAGRSSGAILLNTRGRRMDRHAATRRLHHLAAQAGVRLPRMHPHMLRHILSAFLSCAVEGRCASGRAGPWPALDAVRQGSQRLQSPGRPQAVAQRLRSKPGRWRGGPAPCAAPLDRTRHLPHTVSADRRHTYVISPSNRQDLWMKIF